MWELHTHWAARDEATVREQLSAEVAESAAATERGQGARLQRKARVQARMAAAKAEEAAAIAAAVASVRQ